jgi:Tol biopolymer transport system component
VLGGLAFSPDGNYIYYLRTEKTGIVSVLHRVPALGGTARKLIEDVDSPITFSPDGARIAFVRGYPEPGESALVVANTDGTNERRLAVRKAPDFFHSPAWSPDGRVIACAAGGLTGGSHMSVVEVGTTDGAERPLTSERWLNVEQVAWLADGRGLVMAALDQAARLTQIWHLAYPGGEARRVTNDLNNYHGLSLAADSRRLVAIESDQLSNLWVAPSAEAGSARQITYGSGKYSRLCWTPDGKIIFAANSGGTRDLWMMEADGSNRKQLTAESGVNMWPTVTPDGRYLVFSSNRASAANTFNLWRMELSGGNAQQLTRGSGEFAPRLSPDGKWVVYMSIGLGKPTLWKVPIEGGEPVQLTDKPSALPAVSPDGKLIACQYWDEQLNSRWVTAIIPIEGGAPVKVFNFQATAIRWSPDGRALTYIDQRGGVSNLWSQSLSGEPPRQLTDFKGDYVFDFDWSRDGKQLALARGVVTNDVVLISDLK